MVNVCISPLTTRRVWLYKNTFRSYNLAVRPFNLLQHYSVFHLRQLTVASIPLWIFKIKSLCWYCIVFDSWWHFSSGLVRQITTLSPLVFLGYILPICVGTIGNNCAGASASWVSRKTSTRVLAQVLQASDQAQHQPETRPNLSCSASSAPDSEESTKVYFWYIN